MVSESTLDPISEVQADLKIESEREEGKLSNRRKA